MTTYEQNMANQLKAVAARDYQDEAKCARPAQVPHGLDRLEKELHVLNEHLLRLEERMGAVLRRAQISTPQPSRVSPVEDALEDGICPMAHQIDLIQTLVQTACYRTNEVLERLEL